MTITCFIRYELDPVKRELFILKEERRFTEVVDAAFQQPALEKVDYGFHDRAQAPADSNALVL